MGIRKRRKKKEARHQPQRRFEGDSIVWIFGGVSNGTIRLRKRKQSGVEKDQEKNGDAPRDGSEPYKP